MQRRLDRRQHSGLLEGGNTGLQLSDPQYVVLENLVIRNTSQNGLNIDDGGSFDTPAHHVVLRNITVEGVGDGGNQDCIKMSGVDDFWVLDSDVSECSGQGIDIVGCHDGVIAGNHIHDKPSAGVQAKGGTADILIHGNRIADVSGRGVNAGGSTGLEYFRPQDAPHEGARIQVVANIFERVGAESGAPIAFVGCDACLFAHNTVVEPQTWVARILQETVGDRFVPSRDGRFVNNVVAFNVDDLRNGVFVNVGPDTAPETFTFANNLWYALDDPDFDGPTLSSGIPAPQNSVVQQDPGFADRAGGDYRIGTSSPAVGAAGPLDHDAGFDGFDLPDYDGHCYGDPAAVGSYEGR
ncbi:MAG: right-handed parallel beta-helix repeat-containing protein [Persicimonas sp.]